MDNNQVVPGNDGFEGDGESKYRSLLYQQLTNSMVNTPSPTHPPPPSYYNYIQNSSGGNNNNTKDPSSGIQTTSSGSYYYNKELIDGPTNIPNDTTSLTGQLSSNVLSRSLPTLPPLSISNSSVFSETSDLHPSSPLTTTITTQENTNDVVSRSSSSSTNTNVRSSPPLPPRSNNIDTPPPIPPRSHKRYLSASAAMLENNHSTNNQTLTSSSLGNSASSVATPTSILQPNAVLFRTNSQSNLNKVVKSKLLKVITSVKNLPQVDTLLNLSASSSPRNSSPSSNVSSPGYSDPPSLSSSPLPTSTLLETVKKDNFIQQQPHIKEENNLIHVNNSNMNNVYEQNSNNNNNNNNNQTNQNNIKDLNINISFESIPTTHSKSTTTNNNNNNNHEEIIDGFAFELIDKDEDNNQKTPIKSTTSSTTNVEYKSPSLLHLSYRSTFLNQLSQIQNRSERSKFSLPILDISPYPKLSGDDLRCINVEQGESPSSSLYSNINHEITYNNKHTSTTTIKDITLQKYKPLPPLPFSSQNMKNQQKYGKLSSILQLISFSIPEIVSPKDHNDLQSSNNNNNNYGSSPQNEKYQDLTQYLNENGDRIKISQHILWHLDQQNVNIEIVKLLGAHYGFPNSCRATSWMLMTGYLPANKDSRSSLLNTKRLQYRDLVKKYFGDQYKHFMMDENDFERGTNKILHNVAELWSITTSGQNGKSKFKELIDQIHIDVIRTRPDGFNDLFELKEIEQLIERILAIWSSENQDISYFQGLNDLIGPFLLVFLEHALSQLNLQNKISYPSLLDEQDPDNQDKLDPFNLEKILGDGRQVKELIDMGRSDVLAQVEADIYWCLSSLLNSVKPFANGTGTQLPAEGLMKKLTTLVQHSNQDLYQHFLSKNIDFSFFSFRWMVCFLSRDLSTETGIKLWDRYMCDKANEGFSLLHISFCAAILSNLSNDLMNMDFMELVQTLQKTDLVDKSELEPMLRTAHALKQTYRHLIQL